MIYSLLADENMCFVSLHAECALHTYSSEFFQADIISDARKTKGIYCRKINADVLKSIYDQGYEGKNICVDFAKIEEISDNNLVGFISFIKKRFCSQNKAAYFLNLDKKICDKMQEKDAFQVIDQSEEAVFGKIGNAKSLDTYKDLTERRRKLFDEKLEKMIIDSTDDITASPHTSVPVYLSKYINLKKMMESDARMLRLSIYYLALRMIDRGIASNSPSGNHNLSLFFHTMSGGYIAAQLAELFHVNLVYLDHLGPIESVHRKHFEQDIHDGRDYVIVSDVICLGGEIGRARTIIEYCGGKVLGETSIVDVQSVQSERLNSRTSLYTISKECNKVGYTIRTELCDTCGACDMCGGG